MTAPRYMLDTNIISDIIRNPGGKVAKRIRKTDAEELCVSIVTAAELRFGGVKRGSQRLIDLIEQILNELDVLALDVPADAAYARIRNSLERAGQPIGPNDLLIAAHALSIGAVLVTANAKEFRRLRDLKVQNWLA